MDATDNSEAGSPGPRADRTQERPRIGLVLGAGAARGWAHIGALRALDALGVKPDIVVGCSSGALVGAAYAAGRLDGLEAFARALTWRGVLGFFDLTWRGGGLIQGRWLADFFREHVGDVAIEDVAATDGGPRFGAVATELRSGREAWLTTGSMVDAVRASISLPGLIAPVELRGRWLVDGALVNPVPVSLCRAMGADVIIAVSMQGDLVTNARGARAAPIAPAADAPARSTWLEWLAQGGPLAGAWVGPREPDAPPPRPQAGPMMGGLDRASRRPGYFEVIGDSFFTVQNFVSRVRLAADPVDLLIAPPIDAIGVFDFHRGAEAIAAGSRAVHEQSEAVRATTGAPCAREPAPRLAESEPAPRLAESDPAAHSAEGEPSARLADRDCDQTARSPAEAGLPELRRRAADGPPASSASKARDQV